MSFKRVEDAAEEKRILGMAGRLNDRLDKCFGGSGIGTRMLTLEQVDELLERAFKLATALMNPAVTITVRNMP